MLLGLLAVPQMNYRTPIEKGQTLNQAEADALERLGENRADFMKRWFAIAISVGFATALSSMPWLKNGAVLDRSLPADWEQIKQLARLTAAVIATILSWDGYFQSIRTKPLQDGLRFGIDIFLVFLYFFILLTSKFDYFWLWAHATAFGIYCIWDAISIIKHTRSYLTEDAPEDFDPHIFQIYLGSIRDREFIRRSPCITPLWSFYFLMLPMTHSFILSATDREHPLTTFLYAFFVVVGLFAYRNDKKECHALSKRLKRIGIGASIVLIVAYGLRLHGEHITIAGC